MDQNSIFGQITLILGDVYGVEPFELTPESDFIEDIDLKSSVESLAQLVHTLNQSFDIDLSAQRFSKALEENQITNVQDIVNTVEDALLE